MEGTYGYSYVPIEVPAAVLSEYFSAKCLFVAWTRGWQAYSWGQGGRHGHEP